MRNGSDDELLELRVRVEALELRQAAVEARQVRIERLLMSQEQAQQATNKLLSTFSEHMQKLTDRVAEVVQAVGKPPKAKPSPKR